MDGPDYLSPMARSAMCAGVGLSGGREGQACSPTCTGPVLAHFECRGAPARVRVWRCEGRPPLPHQPPLLCGEIYLTLPAQHHSDSQQLSRAAVCALWRRAEHQSTMHRPAENTCLVLIKISQRSWHCPLGHHPRRRDAILGAAADGAAGTDSVVAGRGVGRRRMARRGSAKTPNTR